MAEDNYKRYEVQLKFMSPGSRLAGDTFNEQGNKVKSANEPFTKEDIASLQEQGCQKLYYVKDPIKPAGENGQDDQVIEDIPSLVQSTHRKKHSDADVSLFLCDIEKRARALMCNISTQMAEYFIPRLIANGIALYKATSPEEAEVLYKKYKISHLLIDLDFDTRNWLNFLEKVNNNNNNNQSHLYVFYGHSSRDNMEALSEKGWVKGSYDKNRSSKEVAKQLVADINESDSFYSQRSHLKVLLGEDDPVHARIYLSEEQIIKGEGFTLSPLEIVIDLSKTIEGEMYNFGIGDKLERVNLTILGKILVTQAEVIGMDGKTRRMTLKFTHRSESLMKGIGKLFMNKLKRISF